jgi:hypothetical protein
MADGNDFFKRLTDSTSLTDVLIQMEDFLDGLDLYVFKNWFEGEVVEGPIVSRYWTKMTLKYAYKEMPDPSGGERLIKHGAKVFFSKAKEETPRELESPSDYRPGRPGKPALDELDIWLVEIHIPRRFIEELDDDDLAMYQDEDDINMDHVSDARDEDIDDTDAITDNDPDAPSEAEEDMDDEIKGQ